ncbi:MAG: uracil-DNA glycosylase family protein [Microbacteriaceae bacterium]
MSDARCTPMNALEAFRRSVIEDSGNRAMTQQGWEPLLQAAPGAKIAVIGQAPGRLAQASGIPWDDASGKTLIDWLGVTEEQFRDPNLFALAGMDFYYPGRGRSGDLPPRAGFAARWHPPLFRLMPTIGLTLLVGRYAQAHYLPESRRSTLTEAVRNFEYALPEYFPLVHPSPLNFRWHLKNPWFVVDVVPELRAQVRRALEVKSSEAGRCDFQPMSEQESPP